MLNFNFQSTKLKVLFHHPGDDFYVYDNKWIIIIKSNVSQNELEMKSDYLNMLITGWKVYN